MTSKLLWAENIDFRRQNSCILKNVSLEIRENEIVALIGGNGSGKTTLLEILIGILSPDTGSIYRKKSLLQTKKNSWLGYLPDKAPLYPHWQVKEFLIRCAEMREVTNSHIAADEIIKYCDLLSVTTKKCSALSHGYRQRVGIAQALIHQPTIVVLDEPTNGLDSKQKLALRPLLTSLKKSCSVLLTSHDWEEVINLADRIYYLYFGKLYEILLPLRNSNQLWVECKNNKIATILFTQLKENVTTNLLLDERFIGFNHDNSAMILRQLWRTLSLEEDVVLHSNYPCIALQEKLDHVVQSAW